MGFNIFNIRHRHEFQLHSLPMMPHGRSFMLIFDGGVRVRPLRGGGHPCYPENEINFTRLLIRGGVGVMKVVQDFQAYFPLLLFLSFHFLFTSFCFLLFFKHSIGDKGARSPIATPRLILASQPTF